MEIKVKRKGTVLVFTAVMLTVLMGFAALAIDVGYMYSMKARRQNAADAGVLAAAAVLIDETGLREDLARKIAKEYVNKNDFNNVEIDIKIGEFVDNKVVPTFDIDLINSVQITIERKEDLFFAAIFGFYNARIRATAIAGILPLSSACVVPVALRSPDFGPVDFDVSEANPGKDGPSSPGNNTTFRIGEEVIVYIFGKGPRPPVHLVLDLPQFNGVSETNNILADKRDVGCGFVSLGDTPPVWNNGTGNGNFGVKLVDRMTDDDPDNDTIIAPIIATLPNSHDDNGKLTGNVEIVDFIGIHLERTEEIQVVAGNGNIVTIKILIGKVVPVVVHGETTDDPAGFAFTAFSLKLLR